MPPTRPQAYAPVRVHGICTQIPNPQNIFKCSIFHFSNTYHTQPAHPRSAARCTRGPAHPAPSGRPLCLGTSSSQRAGTMFHFSTFPTVPHPEPTRHLFVHASKMYQSMYFSDHLDVDHKNSERTTAMNLKKSNIPTQTQGSAEGSNCFAANWERVPGETLVSALARKALSRTAARTPSLLLQQAWGRGGPHLTGEAAQAAPRNLKLGAPVWRPGRLHVRGS